MFILNRQLFTQAAWENKSIERWILCFQGHDGSLLLKSRKHIETHWACMTQRCKTEEGNKHLSLCDSLTSTTWLLARRGTRAQTGLRGKGWIYLRRHLSRWSHFSGRTSWNIIHVNSYNIPCWCKKAAVCHVAYMGTFVYICDKYKWDVDECKKWRCESPKIFPHGL